MAYSEPSPSQKQLLGKHKNLIIVASVIIIALVILIAPIIPTQYSVTKTRTRNLRYSSHLYSKTEFGNIVIPYCVNVTNTDSVGGKFSVTMNKWLNNPFDESQKLDATFSQSLFINAGATQIFYVPSNWNWHILPSIDSFTYYVSAPSIQESYNAKETEYKSILNLIESSLRT